MEDLSDNVPNLFYHKDNTHMKNPEGVQLMADVMVAALDFYIQDKEEIRRSKMLVSTEHKSNHFSGTYIRDYNNILRRKAQVVRNVPIQQNLRLPEVVMRIRPGSGPSRATYRQRGPRLTTPPTKGRARTPRRHLTQRAAKSGGTPNC